MSGGSIGGPGGPSGTGGPGAAVPTEAGLEGVPTDVQAEGVEDVPRPPRGPTPLPHENSGYDDAGPVGYVGPGETTSGYSDGGWGDTGQVFVAAGLPDPYNGAT